MLFLKGSHRYCDYR